MNTERIGNIAENVAWLCLAGCAYFAMFACVSQSNAAQARPVRIARPAVVRQLAKVAHPQSPYVIRAHPSAKSLPR